MRQQKIQSVKKLLKSADYEERVLQTSGLIVTIGLVNKHTGEISETWNVLNLGTGTNPELK